MTTPDLSAPRWRKTGSGRSFEFQADLEPVTAHVAAQYHNTHGGSSFYVHGGGIPKEGYVVGGLPGVPEHTIARSTITPEEFQANRDRIRAARPGDSNAVAGSWAENGNSVMDGSNAVIRHQVAKALQTKRGERMVYDISAGVARDLR